MIGGKGLLFDSLGREWCDALGEGVCPDVEILETSLSRRTWSFDDDDDSGAGDPNRW